MLLVVFVINLSVLSTNQGTWIMLSKLFPSWIAPKMISLDEDNRTKPTHIFASATHLTYKVQNFDTPSAPQLQHRITLANISNTPYAWLELPPFDIDHSIIDHHGDPKMYCGAFWLPELVVAHGNIIQMLTHQVRVWAQNAGVRVRQQTAETLWTWHEKGGFIAQWTDHKLREHIWEIA